MYSLKLVDACELDSFLMYFLSSFLNYAKIGILVLRGSFLLLHNDCLPIVLFYLPFEIFFKSM